MDVVSHKKALGKNNPSIGVIDLIRVEYYLEFIAKPMERDTFVFLVSQPFIDQQQQVLLISYFNFAVRGFENHACIRSNTINYSRTFQVPKE